MKKRDIIIFVIGFIVVMGVISILILLFNKNEISDSEKFSEEYQEIASDNVFVYRSIDEIIKILENGTGIVYLGFPECKWCQKYVQYLDEVSRETNLEKIYYFNILEDRTNNTEEYLKIVSILNDYLQYDDEGNKRIYVPTVVAVNSGEIVGFDDETAWDTKGFSEPHDYWTVEEQLDLKFRLTEMFFRVDNTICTECNVK